MFGNCKHIFDLCPMISIARIPKKEFLYTVNLKALDVKIDLTKKGLQILVTYHPWFDNESILNVQYKQSDCYFGVHRDRKVLVVLDRYLNSNRYHSP